MFAESIPAPYTPFDGISAWAVGVIYVAAFAGYFSRGLFGFGSNMLIIIVIAWILGPHHAVLLTLLATGAAQIHLFPQGIKTANWKITRTLLLGQCAGIAVATWLFVTLKADWLTLLLGLLVALNVLMDRFRLLNRLGNHIDMRGTATVSGLAVSSGMLGTLSGGGGIYLLIPYLKLSCDDPGTLRGTALAMSGIFMVARIAAMAAAGAFAPHMLVETALILPVVFLGTWTGSRLFHAISAERYYGFLQFFLITAASALIGRGLWYLL
jgi:hypothetical protein